MTEVTAWIGTGLPFATVESMHLGVKEVSPSGAPEAELKVPDQQCLGIVTDVQVVQLFAQSTRRVRLPGPVAGVIFVLVG
jgi:hypothetical protein